MSLFPRRAQLLIILLLTLTFPSKAETNQDVKPYSIDLISGLTLIDITPKDKEPPVTNLSATIQTSFSYNLTHWLSLDTGLTLFNEVTSRDSDIVGYYTTTIKVHTAHLGGQVYLPITEIFGSYVRLGGVYYRVKLSVEESFNNIKESGRDSATDYGQGYYYAIGFSLNPEHKIKFRFEYQYQNLLDVFSDSSRPFDISCQSIVVGAGILF
ncbi:MAG: outer membrane beta-barrel protein [Thalassolituus oleivorans]|uniref:outer membrane beta-barrel protein n=1 Tax=Thalassolituus oleivorans TaxID=187493 RepID=UPI001B4D9701|nr:outer membrane beta-barrel protein [Thalassolituus oleivorans]MBQ0728676.1 outer membrane beta-barrel protein [Thalassolituus oleivorans]MBQ0779742.1 outer membrane beta-barrel protein [Thalassolituus oleivorans]